MSDKDKFTDLGAISWLWMSSNLHKSWNIQLMMRNTLPALKLKQYHIIFRGEKPVAYCSWAFFSKEAERRYILDPNAIRSSDWDSGDRMWFIDYISPFSTRETLRLKSELREQFHDRYARSLRVKPGEKKAKILTFFGEDVPKGWHNEANAQMVDQFSSMS